MSYKLTEFYALSIPIFVPSPKFYRNNSGLRGVNFINILWAAFSLINFLTSIKRETINNTTQCAKDCGPYNRACEYGRTHLHMYAGSAMFVRSRSYKTFFLRFLFFGVKLGHFTINEFISMCNKHESLPAKNGKNLC